MKGKINNYLSKRYKRSLRIRNTAIAVMLATGLLVSGVVGGESRLQISHAQEVEQVTDENSTGDAAKENITLDNTNDEEVTSDVSENKEPEVSNNEKTDASENKEPEVPETEENDSSKAKEVSASETEEKSETAKPASEEKAEPEAEEESETAKPASEEKTETVEPEEAEAANDSAEAEASETVTSEAKTSDNTNTESATVKAAASEVVAPEDKKETTEKAEAGQTDASSDEGIEDGYEMADPSDSYDATKPTVKLESMSYIKLYDGQPLVDDMQELLVEEGWLDGDGATYTFTESQTEIGSIPNKFTITLNEGTPEGKYNILVKYGELRVAENLDEQQYILSIAGKSGSVKYDGTEQSLQGFILSARGNDEYRVAGKGDPEETLSFTIGESTFYVSGVSAYGSGTDAGDYVVDISGSPTVKDAQGNDVTNNFKFEYVPGVLTIEKRSLKMKSANASKEYDGEDLTKHEVKVTGDGFADGEGAAYKFTGKQKEVGESFNYFTYTLNDGTLESNYNIQTVPGKLTVKEAKKNENENSSENNSSENNSSENGSSENNSSQENSNASGESSGSSEASSESSSNEGTANGNGDGTETASNNSGDSVSTAEGGADTSSEGPAVLGAKKGKDGSTGNADDKPSVLGARKASTDDVTASVAMRILIMLLSAMTVIYITGKNKRKSNG